jgi:hypothetical protein
MKVNIKTPNKTYDILIDKLPEIKLDTKVAIITNPTVAVCVFLHPLGNPRWHFLPHCQHAQSHQSL